MSGQDDDTETVQWHISYDAPLPPRVYRVSGTIRAGAFTTRRLADEYLTNQITMSDFYRWSHHAVDTTEAEDNYAGFVNLLFAEYTGKHITEDEFREALRVGPDEVRAGPEEETR